MYKLLTLSEVQKEETYILKKTIEFLKKNNISYYIWAGTFLGAVRHKGFIPWDDDIDVIIPRPDYERLKELLLTRNYIAEHIVGIGYELNNSDWPYLKIVNKIVKVENDTHCDEYLWLDIFPLDGIPSNLSRYNNNIILFRKILFLKRESARKYSSFSSNSIKKIIKKLIISFLKPISYDFIIKKYIKYCSKYDYNKSKYIRNNVSATTINNYIDKENMESTIYNFEGLKVKGLKDYDLYLSRCYGSDYMKLPPVEKRVTHSFKAWRITDDKE